MNITGFTSDMQRVLAEAQGIPVIGIGFSLIKLTVSAVQITAAAVSTVFSGIAALCTLGLHKGINNQLGHSLSQLGSGIGGAAYSLFNLATLGIGGYLIEYTLEEKGISAMLVAHNESFHE